MYEVSDNHHHRPNVSTAHILKTLSHYTFLSTFVLGKSCKIVKSATLVEGNPKAPFSIATTPRCRGGCYSIPWIASLYP